MFPQGCPPELQQRFAQVPFSVPPVAPTQIQQHQVLCCPPTYQTQQAPVPVLQTHLQNVPPVVTTPNSDELPLNAATLCAQNQLGQTTPPPQRTLYERANNYGARANADDMTAHEAEQSLFNEKEVPSLTEVIKAYPDSMGPMLNFAHTVIHVEGCFLMAEKYLIGGYVAKLLGCQFCQVCLESAAMTCGVDEGLLHQLLVDIDSAPVSRRLKPVFKYIRKLTVDPISVTHADTQAILAEGWPKRAVFEASQICNLYNMMVRCVLANHVQNTVENTRASGELLAKV